MPQFEKPELISAIEPDLSAPATLAERVDFVVGFLRRRYLTLLICLLLSLPFGALYLFITPATYTASATMMMETRPSRLQESLMGDAPADPAWLESQIGVLKSQNIAAYVVKQLRLAEDPKYIRSDGGLLAKLLAKLLAPFGWEASKPKSESERAGAAIAEVRRGLDVRRVGQSYMLQIDFRSEDPERAIKIANAMTDAYIFDQLNAKYQANRRSGDWLQERLQTLREQAAAAERAVIEFKTKNNIVTAGGSLMNEKQLSEISGQLAAARARASDVQVRLERIEAVRRAYQEDEPAAGVDETVSEAMNNGIIGGLRARYLDLLNRQADWSHRYGKNHVAVVNLRNQIRDIRKSIHNELGRIQETHRSEYEIAKKRQDELEKGLAKLISQSTETNQAQVALFSLEAAAQSYRKLYDSFLQRHTEATQQQSFPISYARMLSSASVIKTGPKTLRTWMLTIFAGGALGIAFGAFREIMDRGFRTREQVRSVLEIECLALIPALTESTLKRSFVSLLMGDRSKNFFSSWSPTAAWRDREYTTPIVDIGRAPETELHPVQAMMRSVVEAPSSPFAEAMQAIKLGVDFGSLASPTKVIGLTSCVSGEGKSTIAAGLAAQLAKGGGRIVLVDCDIRNPSLSRALAPNASAGIIEVATRKVDLTHAVWHYPNNRIAFLPMVIGPHMRGTIDILSSDAAKSVFDALRVQYDYIIVDLSPLAVATDVRATSRFINSYILIVEWGSTKVDAVQYAFRNAPEVHKKIIGTVLNKVDMAAMSHYDNYGAQYYYARYGQADRRN